MVHADRAATTARLVHDGQARRLIFMKFPLRLFQSFTCITASGDYWSHDFADGDLGRVPVVGRHAVTNVAFSDNTDQIKILFILNNGSAPTARNLPPTGIPC